MAAHLAGAIASQTCKPVIGVPLSGGAMDGLDALLSTVQMPSSMPVATVSIGKAGAINAAYLAMQIAKSLLYIADNAGENIFDTLLIATLKAIYPHLSISYAVRGRAIINDLTLQDMLPPTLKAIYPHLSISYAVRGRAIINDLTLQDMLPPNPKPL